MRRRIFAAGEPMPLPLTYAKGVLFVGLRIRGQEKIGGTGFLVSIKSSRLWHTYVAIRPLTRY